MSHKLAVLLHADVQGSTALVRTHEGTAHERIRDTFRRLARVAEKHRGQLREVRGDAVIIEFPRVSDAVTAAVAFQEENQAYNVTLSDDIRPALRIGIAMGEVVVADNTITGEGVILAQRLEQLVEPGGVCLQGAAFDTLPKRISIPFENRGEITLKGFEEPVRAYVVMPRGDAETGSGPLPRRESSGETPSIAVLPFRNLSADPDQEYFSDGIAEDIITALSKVSDLMVIARSSAFTYKDRSVDMRQVGREQGVRYVLEGSVRKSGDRIRVTAQLGDARSGQYLWAERYDRQLDDLFKVQDDLMREIVVALDVRLREGEQLRMWSSGTDSVEAWECVRLGAPIILGGVKEELGRAKQWVERAIELDPGYAMAWTMLGWYHQNFADVATGVVCDAVREEAMTRMLECASRAIELDPQCADAYSVLALYWMERREYDKALDNAMRSVEFAPGNAENLVEAGGVLTKCGRAPEALELVRKAIRLCPLYRAGFLRGLAMAYRFSGEVEKAAESYRQAVKRHPDLLSGQVNLASVLGELGRLGEARQVAAEVLRLAPAFSIRSYAGGLSYREPADLERVIAGLQAAGLPD